jgi:hypothetical protein
MFYWFCAAAAVLASAWAILIWLVMWIVSLLTVVRKSNGPARCPSQRISVGSRVYPPAG